MQTFQEIYHAKIMLFGEYSVICDSMGLTIPYAHFTAELNFIDHEQYTDYNLAVESNQLIKDYHHHLQYLEKTRRLIVDIDLERLGKDLDNGLYLESTIPRSYGIGSSGALVAAIYDRYASGPVKRKKIFGQRDISKLKVVFAQMESYFHGVSSGIDPLLCYINSPLLMRNANDIEAVGIPKEKLGLEGAIFLIDTKVIGKTGPLVNKFFEWCNDETFMMKIRTQLIPANNAAIIDLLEGKMDSFFRHLNVISSFQYDHFKDMIPAGFQEVWQEGLQRDDYKIKLCGSGGGGFLLGITRNYSETREHLLAKGINHIVVFKNS